MSYTGWFTDPFTDNAQILFDLLFTKEFDAEALQAHLKTGQFKAEDVNLAAYRYVDECSFAALNACENHLFDHLAFGETLPGIESSHLIEAITILLEYGLDPNKILIYNDGGQTNIMEEMLFVRNGYLAADAAAVMLEHGGNPSLLIENESLIRNLNQEMFFQLCGNEEFRYFSDTVMHYWMVFIGYGAKLEDGGESVDPVDHFDISKFKNHRQYYYGMIHSDRSNDGVEICFFDKDTNREVARF